MNRAQWAAIERHTYGGKTVLDTLSARRAALSAYGQQPGRYTKILALAAEIEIQLRHTQTPARRRLLAARHTRLCRAEDDLLRPIEEAHRRRFADSAGGLIDG
jgi:hypothetical protein